MLLARACRLECLVHRVARGRLALVDLLLGVFTARHLFFIVNHALTLGCLFLPDALVGHGRLARALMEHSLLRVLGSAAVARVLDHNLIATNILGTLIRCNLMRLLL